MNTPTTVLIRAVVLRHQEDVLTVKLIDGFATIETVVAAQSALVDDSSIQKTVK